MARECNISNEELLKLFKRCNTISYRNESKDADYAFEVRGDHLYIYFEPSDSRTDWIHNLWFPAKPYKHMKTVWFAHRGFLAVWNQLRSVIRYIIDDFAIRSITIVGYSHGAALAVFAHECVWYDRPDIRDNLNTYAFGAPRVFFGFKNKKLRERWKNFYPIRNDKDLVTHVPPKFFGFSHVNKIIKLDGESYGPINSHRPEAYITNLGGTEDDIREVCKDK